MKGALVASILTSVELFIILALHAVHDKGSKGGAE